MSRQRNSLHCRVRLGGHHWLTTLSRGRPPTSLCHGFGSTCYKSNRKSVQSWNGMFGYTPDIRLNCRLSTQTFVRVSNVYPPPSSVSLLYINNLFLLKLSFSSFCQFKPLKSSLYKSSCAISLEMQSEIGPAFSRTRNPRACESCRVSKSRCLSSEQPNICQRFVFPRTVTQCADLKH